MQPDKFKWELSFINAARHKHTKEDMYKCSMTYVYESYYLETQCWHMHMEIDIYKCSVPFVYGGGHL